MKKKKNVDSKDDGGVINEGTQRQAEEEDQSGIEKKVVRADAH